MVLYNAAASELTLSSVLVQGDVPVREVVRKLDIDLPEMDRWSTMAGLCLELAGRIPAAGERFTVPGGIEVEVVDASPRQVRAVRVRLPAAEDDEAGKAREDDAAPPGGGEEP